MVSPFYFILTIVPIALVSCYFFYRGLSGHGGSFVLSGVGFFIISIYLFAFGIPSDPLITTTVVSSTVTTNAVTYTAVKASNDAVVNGIAYLFAAFSLLSFGIGIGAIPQSMLRTFFPGSESF